MKFNVYFYLTPGNNSRVFSFRKNKNVFIIAQFILRENLNSQTNAPIALFS